MNTRKMVVSITLRLLLLASLTCLSSTAIGASLDKAKMFQLHGLTSETKKELIEVIFSKQNAKNKAEAYYILGTIAFEEDKLTTALETWTELVKEFPESEQAQLVKDRINQLSESVGEVSRKNLENVIAQSYLRNAEFWSQGKSRAFTIYDDQLYLLENAISWYDKVIQEFPKTTASLIAYEDKMRALIGWKEPGEYGRAYGIKQSFIHHMPQLVETFLAFEKDHPNTLSLQAFRYQIGQIYWQNDKLPKAALWFHKIIQQSGDNYTFYRDLAERRLKDVERSLKAPGIKMDFPKK